jgi:hypothetical protein
VRHCTGPDPLIVRPNAGETWSINGQSHRGYKLHCSSISASYVNMKLTYVFLIPSSYKASHTVSLGLNFALSNPAKRTELVLGWWFNPLNAELNPIHHLLALAGAHHFVHVSRLRVKRCGSNDLIQPAFAHICSCTEAQQLQHRKKKNKTNNQKQDPYCKRITVKITRLTRTILED